MPGQYRPTRQLQLRLAKSHDAIVKALNDYESISDRRGPAPPDVEARAARLLAAARDLLSRHRLAREVPPLKRQPPPAASDLFVRMVRAMVALRTLYDELDALDRQ